MNPLALVSMGHGAILESWKRIGMRASRLGRPSRGPGAEATDLDVTVPKPQAFHDNIESGTRL